MQMLRKRAGSTDVSVVLRIIDATDGTPETGVAYNTSGIDLEYRREGAASVDITEATLAALTTAHTDGGFLHIGNGYYRLDLPDAAVATGAAGVLIHGTVTGMVVIGAYIELDPVPADVRQFGGTDGTFSGGRPEVNTSHAAGTAWNSGAITAATLASDALGAAKLAADAVTEIVTGVWGAAARTLTALDEDNTTLDLDATIRSAMGMASANLDTQLGDLPTNAELAARTLATADYATAANLATVHTVVDGIKLSTDNLPSDPADQSLLIAATNSILTAVGTVDTVVDSIKVTTDKLDDTLEPTSDGYVFSDAALANAPTGGGGGGPTAEEIADEVQTRTIAAVTVVNGLANNAVTAAALATDAVAEIQTGLATAAALATVDGIVDDILVDTAAIDARLPSDPADQSLLLASSTAIYDRIGAPAGASIAADVAAVKTDSAAILLDTGTDGVVVATASKTGYRLSATGVDDILDEVVEGTTTLRQSQRLHNAVLGGKASGLETTAATFRDLGDTKDVVVATVDGDGNRTAVTTDLT